MHLYKRENGIWYLKFMDDNGRIQRISTGEKVKSKAFKYLVTYIPKPIQIKTPKLTLTEFKTEYLEYAKATMTKETVNNVTHYFNLFCKEFGNACIDNIGSRELEKFLLNYFSVKKYGAHACYRIMKAAFNKAIVWNYLKENPIKKIKLPKLPQRKPHFITEEQLLEIIGYCNNQTLKHIYLTAFYTGMRLREIMNLTWDQVDLNREIINVSNSEFFTTKSKRERSIPICKKLLNLLNPLNVDYNPVEAIKRNIVFYKVYGVPYSCSYVSHKFKKYATNAGLSTDIHFHTLRHSFASVLVSKGASLYHVKELLGHRDFSTTSIYSHLSIDSLISTVNLLDKTLS